MIPVSFVQLKYAKTRKILFPKLIKKSKLDTSASIIAVIGENASGKTNLLKIIKNAMLQKKTGLVSASTQLIQESVYTCQVQVNEIAEVLEYEPTKYSKHVTLEDQNIPVDLWMDLKLFRASESECSSLYFTEFFKEHKNIIQSQKPYALFIDEPENSLDPSTIDAFLRTVRSWTQNKNAQVFITTHSLFVLEYADKILELQPNYLKTLAKRWNEVSEKYL